MNTNTPRDYWKTVESIAKDIMEEYPDKDDDGRHDYVHESVDGSAWKIYYGQNETVLEATNNEPDDRDVMAMANPDSTWRDMRQTAAYLAMKADIYHAITKLDEAREVLD